ncbi:MAG: zf-HC2 domain-containing protein [Acidobacteriota bacterium]
MRCLRFDIHKNFPFYIDDELNPAKTKQLEDHLLDCNWCRAQVARLRDGQRFAAKLARRQPPRDNWAAIAAALDNQSAGTPAGLPKRRFTIRREFFLSPWFAVIILALMVVGLSLALIIQAREPQEIYAARIFGQFDRDEYHPVNISEMESNKASHVVAEGYVSEVKISPEDGDLVFKLVEDIERPSPFIVCEIISPIHLEPPTVGSRVRVYGVSRYDAEEGREWYEVHPVLNIEALDTHKRKF